MSNRAELVATRFVTKNGDSSYGYRLYDDYAAKYCNYHDPSIMDASDFDLLQLAIQEGTDGIGSCLLGFIQDEELGITINDTYYDWDEIKHLF